jgi:hypothetical protein
VAKTPVKHSGQFDEKNKLPAGASELRCCTCHQPFREGEETDTFQGETYHENPDHCVAAVARRCAEIALQGPDDPQRSYQYPDETAKAIRAEFPEAQG